MQHPVRASGQIQYVVYDTESGAIVGTYATLNAETNEYVPVQIDEVKALFSQDGVIAARLSGKDTIDVIPIEQSAQQATAAGPMVVDLKTKRLVLKPSLRLTVDKPQLNGDGRDTAVIEIQAVDAQGKPVRSLEGEVRVTTERGKLSERGGMVKLVQGLAKLELTAVNETVRRVRVRAEALNGGAASGEAVIEFV
jgi:hypothetical protein